MFEAEVEMEKRSSFGPLLLIVALIVAIVGTVGYFFWQAKKGLPVDQATALVSSMLQAQGPVTVHFHVGSITPSVNEKPDDPHYRLLEKAGILKLSKTKKGIVQVALTPDGEKQLAELPGVKKTADKDGTTVYEVPLAERQLVQVSKVTMRGADVATVEYTWKWTPNKLGDLFDAGGDTMKSFKVWDRQTLINKYGADFYHTPPAANSLVFVRGGKGWQPSS